MSGLFPFQWKENGCHFSLPRTSIQYCIVIAVDEHVHLSSILSVLSEMEIAEMLMPSSILPVVAACLNGNDCFTSTPFSDLHPQEG